MQITFLGTSCAKPTKERNHSAIFVSYKSDGILFDCGEGTQRQMTIAGIKPTKVNKIFITHFHGDHVLGLAGLIQTLGISGYDKTLKIFGPKGAKKRVRALFDSCEFEEKVNIKVEEVQEGVIYSSKDYRVEAYSVDHGVETLAYRLVETDRLRIDVKAIKNIGIPESPLLGELQEGKDVKWKGKTVKYKDVTYKVKGKILAYVPDSTMSKNSIKIAQDADILICDSSFDDSLADKAEEYMHLTSRQAAEIANASGAKKLILTHFSTRYKDVNILKQDAEEIFSDVVCAQDFMRIKL